MKYAIISDVHGNAPALRLALADAAANGAEGFLFAGDYCISAPWPNEVVEMIRSLPNAQVICGNDEGHLDDSTGEDGQYEVSRWCARTLTQDNRAWLDALPGELTMEDGDTAIRMAHSSEAFVGRTLHAHFRTSSLPYHYQEGQISRERLLTDFRALEDDAAFMAEIRRLPKGIYIFGHNHIQAHADFEGRVLVNPGSCGMPLDCGEFCAAYSLLSVGTGCISVEERRIPYDVEGLIAQVKQTGQYSAARVWSELIFSEWRTCREKVSVFLWDCAAYADRIGDASRPFSRDTWQAAFGEWTASAREKHPALFVR